MKKNKVYLSIAAGVLALSMLACGANFALPTLPAAAPQVATSANPAVPVTSQNVPTSASAPASAPDLVNQQDALVSLYQKVSPGIVTILTSNALGSGWVYSSDGYIVTNQHVVGSETKVEVDFTNGTKVYGNVVGSDTNSDLAVIKVDVPGQQLTALPLGDSNNLQVGQAAIAIGDPLALNGTTMTLGIISGLGQSEDSNNPAPGQQGSTNQSFYTAGDFIETDALLNHGNSGGPLLDLNGSVIGVNRSIQIDPTTGIPSGLGYAISVNVVKRVVPELIKNGKFDYPFLGAVFYGGSMPLDMITGLGLKSTTGAYITDITPGGPADKAGLKGANSQANNNNPNQTVGAGGDLIIGVDGHPVTQFNDLMRYIIDNKAPGDTITLTVLRGDQKIDVKLTLGVRP